MNPRERLLLAIVGCIAVLFCARYVKDKYFEKLNDLEGDAKKQAEKLGEENGEVQKANRARIEWRMAARHTLFR